MECWAPEDTERTSLADTQPPAAESATTDVLRRMVPKVAHRAATVSAAVVALHSLSAEVATSIEAGRIKGAAIDDLNAKRALVASALAELGACFHILTDEMRDCGQSTELYALGDRQAAVEKDAARFEAGLVDRDARGGRNGGPPMLRIADDYEALAETLRAYARDLDSGLEDT